MFATPASPLTGDGRSLRSRRAATGAAPTTVGCENRVGKAMKRNQHPERKRIRLPPDAYIVAGSAWLVTIGTHQRASVFTDHALARKVTTTIIARCTARGAVLGAFCLMPDHAHLLIQIAQASLVDVISDLKSNTTRLWWQHGGHGPLWQRSFHDRGLRTSHDYERAASYILDNPVRASLVTEWDHYPFTGGALIEPQPLSSAEATPDVQVQA